MSMEYTTAYGQLMDDMLKGQEFAARLQKLLRDSPEAGRIVDQILHIFSRVIRTIDAGAGEGSEAQSGVTCGGKRKAAGGERSSRASNRRRTLPSSGATKIVKDIEDGQAWRKYGQKEILNSKHPKSYFRCTHKYDQNCLAQRQVQRCDEDPESYKVTYIGEHTCHDPHAAATAAAPPHHQTGAADGLHACSHLICFAPSAAATSTTTSVATNQTGLPMLKEEERSCLTPGSSAVHSTAGPDQGDVTSALNFGDDGADLRVFFDDYMCGLDDIFGSAR